MKAVYVTEQGGPEVLTFGDRPDPVMGDDEVLVRVRAASVNRFDIYARSGENRVQLDMPRILGEDLAGEVIEASLPAMERGILPGARVLVDPRIPCWRCNACVAGHDDECEARVDLGYQLDGGYAEMISVPARNVYEIPESLSFEEAAAMPIVFKTAWRMLVTKARVQPGETVLIHAAGSGVGSAAIQVARFFGCHVIVTAGADWKLERAQEMGAHEGVSYAENDAWPDLVLAFTEDRGVDVIIDSVGESLWEGSVRCLARQGRFVTCGVTSGHRVSLHLGQMFVRGLSLAGVGGFLAEEFTTVMRLTQNGIFKGVVGKVFPLREAAEAHRLMESRDFFGKIILTP